MPLTSFYSALTGLNNNAMQINIIGDNLANINTTAYKGSSANFAELLAGTSSSTGSSGNPIQVGLGSSITNISPDFTQGTIAYTGKNTDAAINGNGFFVVSTGGGLGFSRAGNFTFNSTGALINGEGFNVMGYQAVNGVLSSGGALTPIVVEKGMTLSPVATTNLSVTANLDSSAPVPTDFSTAVQIYDSLGISHNVTLTFSKTAPTSWNWNATVPATDLAGGLPTDPPASIGSGALTFDSSGALTGLAANPTLSLTGLASQAADLTVTFGILDNSGVARFTGYGSTSSVSKTSQDGRASSALSDISIDSSGVINGIFDNGQTEPLAQLALGNFPNNEGLLKYKGSTFVAFGNSGEPSIGTPNTGGRGSISASSVEKSNVDIATQFTNLIMAERGYQANSKIITTTDQLYQDTINLKQ